MIVVTGPGRTGTSFLAKLYEGLGFDPGGEWYPSVNAGMEARGFVECNMAVAEQLNVGAAYRLGGRTARMLAASARATEGRVPYWIRRRQMALFNRVRFARDRPDLMDFDALEKVVATHGDQMRQLAATRQVVKDPRFCWTLAAWLAAGADISTIVLTIRPLEAMADSRVRGGFYPKRAKPWAMHNFAYGIGLLLTTAAEYRVPVTILRYPDFLERPDDLYRSLPLPEPRSKEAFDEAFAALYKPDLVHDRR